MIPSRTLAVLATTLAVAIPAAAQHKTPTEAQCREMVNHMVQALKTPVPEKERDKQEARALLERVEKVIKENRERGASECESWSAIMKIAVNQ